MPVRLYAERLPVQLGFSWYRANPRDGLFDSKEQMKVLDDQMCDVATRTTRGRLHGSVSEDELRIPFVRDIQRVKTSVLFQRGNQKTQVFPYPKDPSVKNRMTHQYEVGEIAWSLATHLRLNPYLARAGALPHDVGHAPFGHAGEAVLDRMRRETYGLYFKHNIQSLVVIDDIFRNCDTGQLLDLTFEVRDTVVCHLGETSETEVVPYGALPDERANPKPLDLAELKRGDKVRLEDHRIFYPCTLEGCLVRVSDRISSVARDPEDAVRHNLISWASIPQIAKDVFRDGYGNVNASSIIKTLITSVIENSWDPYHHTIYSIKFGDREARAMKALYNFNFEQIYRHPTLVRDFLGFVPHYIETLYHHYTACDDNPLKRPMTPQEAIDVIAYMTDREVMEEMLRLKQVSDIKSIL
ncbi:MAG TPA: HD domain-containing protein [Candidatus Omnitrophota bacterium]|nr:HD domain-containing protein [Candidatus Omnitrophota bacterium]